MGAAKAWGAALRMAPPWVLESVAALRLRLRLRWGWQLAWRSLSEWQLALASVSLLPPQQGYRRDPNRRRCLEGRQCRIESN